MDCAAVQGHVSWYCSLAVKTPACVPREDVKRTFLEPSREPGCEVWRPGLQGAYIWKDSCMGVVASRRVEGLLGGHTWSEARKAGVKEGGDKGDMEGLGGPCSISCGLHPTQT